MKHLYSWKDPKLEKTCAVVRYGIIGDLIIMSSILPELKKQGYHITLYTTPTGWETVKHDPHIDKVILQEATHIPNAELRSFFDSIEPKYDKFVNLCESVEGTLLALVSNIDATFSHSARHMSKNINYLEFTHALAEVPFVPKITFYMTEEEKRWAVQTRKDMNADFLVVWALAGSAIHKVWPHMDEMFKRLLGFRGLRIVTLGDESAQMLESGWEDEQRIYRRAGKWSIRESLSFLSQADLIIGPETGLMNAASMMSIPKIVLMSHSSVENLTKHWVNTISLIPKNTSCYPCHILHKGFDFCKPAILKIDGEMKKVSAHCQMDITSDQMWEAVLQTIQIAEAA